jgi:hypothetical protein
MKAVKTHLQTTNADAVGEFEKGAQAFAKKVVANIKDYEFVSSIHSVEIYWADPNDFM